MEKGMWLGAVLGLLLVLLVFAVGYSAGDSPTGYGFFDKFFSKRAAIPPDAKFSSPVQLAYICSNFAMNDVDYDGVPDYSDISDFTPFAMAHLDIDEPQGVLKFRNLQVKLLSIGPSSEVGPGGAEEAVALLELKNLLTGASTTTVVGNLHGLNNIWPIPGFEDIDVSLMMPPDGHRYDPGYAVILAVARVKPQGTMINGPDPVY